MVRYYILKDTFSNIKNNKTNIDKIKKYLVESVNTLKIYSNEGILNFVENKGMFDIKVIDNDINMIKIGKYKLICDSSEYNQENKSYHLPIEHILIKNKINKYKLNNNAQIEMYLEFGNNNEVVDLWFETKVNIGIHGLYDIEALLDELN